MKGRMVHNGKPMREWLNEEESSSLTVGLDSSFLMMMIDAREARDIMMTDTPNTFTQMPIDKLDTEDQIIMKIAGVLVNPPVEDSPETHASCVVHKEGTKVSCVEVLRAMCRMLIGGLLFHLKTKEDLELIGFEFNPHNTCVGTKLWTTSDTW